MRNGGTAYLNQSAPSAQREGVQEPHTNLLASTALALDEDGNVGLGNPLELVSDRLHGGSFSENNVQRREIQRSSGFSVVDQGRFFLSAFRRKPAKFAICSTLHVEHQSYDAKTKSHGYFGGGGASLYTGGRKN